MKRLLAILLVVPAALSAQTAAKPAILDTACLAAICKAPQCSAVGLVGASQSITVVLSPYQRQQLAGYDKAIKDIQAHQQTFLSAIIGGVKDPTTIGAWSIELKGDSTIVLTPPKPDSVKTKRP